MHKYYFKVPEGYVLVIASDAIEAMNLYKVRHKGSYEMYDKHNWRLMDGYQALDMVEKIEVKTYDYMSYVSKQYTE